MTTLPPYHADLVTPFPLIHQGKVRDSFAIDDDHMLIVASDRLSAFDVVMAEPIPGKGEILTRISNFWFEKTADIVPNHLAGIPVAEVIDDAALLPMLERRSVVVKRLKPLPLEAVVRGYLIGSGWKDYRANGMVCGIELPAGLRQADRLPDVIFTPSSKAGPGEHDPGEQHQPTDPDRHRQGVDDRHRDGDDLPLRGPAGGVRRHGGPHAGDREPHGGIPQAFSSDAGQQLIRG